MRYCLLELGDHRRLGFASGIFHELTVRKRPVGLFAFVNEGAIEALHFFVLFGAHHQVLLELRNLGILRLLFEILQTRVDLGNCFVVPSFLMNLVPAKFIFMLTVGLDLLQLFLQLLLLAFSLRL